MTADAPLRAPARPGLRSWGPILVIIVLAFGLRAFHLAAQSIWYDEGLSILYAGQPLSGLFSLVGGSEHPPLYFLLLWLWVRLAGPVTPAGEFVVRFPSLAWGVLLVALAWRLGCDLLDRRATTLAALLLALSPFQVWYSQETRMYTQAAALNLLAGILLLRALEARRARFWLFYAITTAASLYTHLYTLFAIAFHAVYVTWWAYRRRASKALPVWGLCQAGALLSFAPWGRLALQQLQFNDTYWRGPVHLKPVIMSLAQAFVVGETWTRWPAPLIAAVYFLVGLTGLASLTRGRQPGRTRALTFLSLFVIVPVMGVLLVTLTRPKFAPRYLLPVTPAAALLVAQGLVAVVGKPSKGPTGVSQAILAGGLLAALLAGGGLGLWGLYFDPDQARPDFRAVAGYVRTHAEPGDAVLVVAGHAHPAYLFYDADRPVYPMPPRLLPTVTQPLDRATVAEALNRIVAEGHRRLWLVLWQEELADPRRLVINQLFSHGRRLPVGQIFHDVSLLLFELGPETHFAPQPLIQTMLLRNFGDQLELVGFDLDRREVQAGDTLRLRLHWRVMRPLSVDYTAFTHLINQAEHIYGQHDRRLGGDFFPTSLWPEGELVSEDYAIRVQPGTPPGRYLLEVGAYLPSTGERLPLLAEGGKPEGDRLVLAEIEVQQAILPAAEMDMDPLPAPADFGPLQLLGYRLPNAPLPSGAVLHLILYWQASAPGAPDVKVHLRLLDEAGRVVHEHVAPPADGLYPPDRWEAGEIVRDVHGMLIPPQTAPGWYRVAVRLGESGPFAVLPRLVQVRRP